MERITFDKENGLLRIETDGDPDEVLRVKTLPGRWYDGKQECWFVPVRPGLAKRFEAIFKTPMIAALIAEHEEHFLSSIRPRAITLTQAFELPAKEALAIARAHHFYVTHEGNEADFVRNHGRLELD